MADEEVTPEEEPGDLMTQVGKAPSWEFWDKPPTEDEVRGLLETLPDVYGIRYVDYFDYVQPLPQDKKVQGPRTTPGGPKPAVEYRSTWSLYMSVGGRIAMLNAAAALNGWEVDFRPEFHTPDGCPPGFIEFTERLVYREYCVIQTLLTQTTPIGAEASGRTNGTFQVPLGSKPGTAWVPRTGGSQAKGSNPYEKVETAARGRSIAAWGIGVLPGTGVASLEEMQGVEQNRAAAEGQANGNRGQQQRVPREQLVQETLTLAEEVRQIRGIAEEDMRERLGDFMEKNLGIPNGYDGENDKLAWNLLKDGQIILLRNSLAKTVQDARLEGGV